MPMRSEYIVSLSTMAAAHDHALRALVLARLVALGVLAPRADRVALGAGPALTTAVRVIDRVHRHTPHRRTDAAPALRPRFTNGAQVVLFIAHLADGGAAVDVHL